MRGTVTMYNEDKGYGMIKAETGESVIFHSSAILSAFNAVRAGQHVIFDLVQDRRGPKAENVQSE